MLDRKFSYAILYLILLFVFLTLLVIVAVSPTPLLLSVLGGVLLGMIWSLFRAGITND